MKKLTFMAALAIAAASITSCGNSTPKANLKSDVDSMSYAIGMAQTQGLKEYLVGRLGVDTTYMKEFIKGLNEGANAGDDKKKAAYYAGIQIGQQISNQMVMGINHEVFGDDSTKTISLKNFMAANKKKDGVKTLPSGVQYKVIKEGNGAIPTDTSMVSCHYEGRTIDGKVFDSSYKRNQPLKLRCNQTIKGWTDAMVHMPVGSTWEVYIPQELAYGDREQGDIKPFSVLIFKIELLGIEK